MLRYINDGIGLHAVRCADDTDLEEGAVTLVRRGVCGRRGGKPAARRTRSRVECRQEKTRTAGAERLALISLTVLLRHVPSSLQHLYAPPVRRVLLFEPEEGRVVLRAPGLYSRGGVRCQGAA